MTYRSRPILFSLFAVALGCGDGATTIRPDYIPSLTTGLSTSTQSAPRSASLKDGAEPTGNGRLPFVFLKEFYSRGSELDRAICVANAIQSTGVVTELFDGTARVFDVQGDIKIKVQATEKGAIGSAKVWVCRQAPTLTQSGYVSGNFGGGFPELMAKTLSANGAEKARLRITGEVAETGSWTKRSLELVVDGTNDVLMQAQQTGGYMMLNGIRINATFSGAVTFRGNSYLSAADASSKNTQSPTPSPAYGNFRIEQGSGYLSAASSLVHIDDDARDTTTPSALANLVTSPTFFTTDNLNSRLADTVLIGSEVWDCSGSEAVDLSGGYADKKAAAGALIYGRSVGGWSFDEILNQICI